MERFVVVVVQLGEVLVPKLFGGGGYLRSAITLGCFGTCFLMQG